MDQVSMQNLNNRYLKIFFFLDYTESLNSNYFNEIFSYQTYQLRVQ